MDFGMWVRGMLTVAAIFLAAGGTLALQFKYVQWLEDRPHERILYFIPIVPVVLLFVGGVIPDELRPVAVIIVFTWMAPFMAIGVAAIMTWPDTKDDLRKWQRERKARKPHATRTTGFKSDDDVKPFKTFAELEAAYKAENDAT